MSSILDRYALGGSSPFLNTRTVSAMALSSGSGRKFVVCSVIQDGTKETSAVTFNGASCALIVRHRYNNVTQDWFYYDIPDVLGAGNYDWVFTFSTSTSTGHTYAAWVTQGDTPGAPTYAVGTQAAGTATVSATIATVATDVLLTTAGAPTTGGTSWNNCSSAQVTVANRIDTSLGGVRFGKADAAADASETVTVTWTHNVTTDPLSTVVVNTTPIAGGGGGGTIAGGRYRVAGPVR